MYEKYVTFIVFFFFFFALLEPPHIKNWFSSYEYESFVLETNDNFGFSEHQGSEDFENECSTGNTIKQTENSRELVTNGKNEGVLIKCNQSEEHNKCQKQVLESQDSPLLTPEPPSIENWFSSYAYESPVMDTIGDDHKECMVDCNEKMEFKKEENLCVTPDDLVCEQTSKCDNVSTKDDKNSTDLPTNAANVNSFENRSEKLEEPGDDFVSCLTKDDKKSTDLPNNGAHVKSFETESRKFEDSGNGFVSTKSKKENYEKSKRVKGVGQKRCVDSPVNKMKKSDERVTLGDVTNILDEHSNVTGKWKCPRKRKPDVGPPLKQLRLGQWFHHV
ncbi:hypothetical protein HanXRQr2_Chr11g0473941 [Helianthus annuus]|uniref:Uncharacterized protein n=1 Tax=Helianthus annuus TaxID=4232 RepID=A0A9K3HLZ5_HELAN|nr:hypothetical protein HanXRQr2_Chr11g0473941 [Helianthus annuus]